MTAPPDAGRARAGATVAGAIDAFAAHIRDPDGQPAPAGIDPRRMQVYRELFFDNIARLLAGNFPVIRRIRGQAWPDMVRDFYRGHGCTTALFPEIAREFLRWLEQGGGGDEPWLAELAHYEWMELALQTSTARDADVPHDALAAPGVDARSALLDGSPLLSPLAWPLAYAWPVHRIGPGLRPTTPPEAPTLLLLHRQADGRVRFHAPSPLAWRLLQRLDEAPALSGRGQLEALQVEAQAAGDAGFLERGADMLLHWHHAGIVPGIRSGGELAPLR